MARNPNRNARPTHQRGVDPARAWADRNARAGRAVYAIHVERTSDVADLTEKIGRRGAEGKSVAHPADRERIAPAVEHQRAAAARAAHDKTGLDNVEADAAAVGVGGRQPGAGYSQSYQCGTNGPESTHRLNALGCPLWASKRHPSKLQLLPARSWRCRGTTD